jgi:hypothetical protein
MTQYLKPINPIRTLIQDNYLDFSSFSSSLTQKMTFLRENFISANYDDFYEVSKDLLNIITEEFNKPSYQVYSP